jgi:hypothetical protein
LEPRLERGGVLFFVASDFPRQKRSVEKRAYEVPITRLRTG